MLCITFCVNLCEWPYVSVGPEFAAFPAGVCPPGSTPTWGEWGCNSSANVVMRSATCNDSNMTTVTDTMDGTPGTSCACGWLGTVPAII